MCRTARNPLTQLESELGDLPATLTARTGSGGKHLFFSVTSGDAIRNRTGMRPGIDVRGNGGYIVASPSKHASGADYCWLNEMKPALLPTALKSEIWKEEIPPERRPHC